MSNNNSMYQKDILAAVFLTSLAILLFEMAQIRVFSFSLPAILSYMGISLAMLGFGIGAMLLSMMQGIAGNKPRVKLTVLIILQSLSMVVSSILFATFAWDSVVNMHRGYLPLIMKILLPCTMPYFFAGLFIAIVFSSAKERIGKLYFWNLLGAGLGAVLITIILRQLGAEKVICAAAMLTLVAGLFIAWPSHRVLSGVTAAMLIALAFMFPSSKSLMKFTPRPDDGTGYYQLLAAKEKGMGGEITNEFSEWNIVGRIDIWKQAGNKLNVPEETDYRLLTVDSGAATVLVADPGKENWGGELFEETCYGFAYHAKPNPESVVVIGPGGGKDVQTALHWGAGKITAVEINSTSISAVTGPYASFLKWPLSEKVTLVHEDGRSFMKNTKEQYDVIQLTGIDTLTINATGAFNMVEESLYTVEAFEDFIKALKPDGVFAVVRFLETDLRYTTVAAEALLRQGVTEPQYHIAAFRQGLMAAIVVSKSRFTEQQLNALHRMGERTTPNNVSIPPYEVFKFRLNDPVSIMYLPDMVANPKYTALFDVMNAGSEKRQDRLKKAAIASDDKPFDIIMGFLYGMINLPIRSNFKLFKQFWVGIVILAFICIMLPVVVLGRKSIAKPSLCWLLPYFALIGLSFMMLEINMINRFTIFIGSPGASIAVVLTSILIASGVGSYVSGFGAWAPHNKIAFATLILIIAALSLKFFAPAIFKTCYALGANQELRGLVAGMMLVPLGFGMGWFFPSGLRAIDLSFSEAGHLVPWAISINGFASVVGSVVALPITLWFGFNNLFWLSLTGYILTGLLTFTFFRKTVSS